MKFLIVVLILLVGSVSLLGPTQVFAACPPDYTNACSTCDRNGPTCVVTDPALRICSCLWQPPDPDNPFGAITSPIPGTLIGLLNNILRLIFVVGGILAFLKIIIAGLGFMNAGGDPKKIESAWTSIWQSLLGLVIIISSIAVAALLGLILFGDPAAILNPKVYGPGGP